MAETSHSAVILCCHDMGASWKRNQYERLSETLHERTSLSFGVLPHPSDIQAMAHQIQTLVEAGASQITFLPVSLVPLNVMGTVSHAVSWSKKRWSELQFQTAPPLRWSDLSNWVEKSVSSILKSEKRTPKKTALVLCGPGLDDPLRNANLGRLAHLLYECSLFFRIESAFLDAIRPEISEVLSSISREPVEDMIVVPWQLAEKEVEHLQDVLARAENSHHQQIHLIELDFCHSAFVNLLLANLLAASPLETVAAAGNSNSSSLTDEERFDLQQLQQRIEKMLPSEYQGNYEAVSPRSMGTAALKREDDGQVAWDQIWTSFCDLALAGGPPHRGKLLEAVTAEEARSNPEAYQAVVNEVKRGIRMVTPLTPFDSPVLGWVGVECGSEEMAAWLMRAIIVENVMVRREGANLFLPAGPGFRVEKEIKNIITTIAKTVHYWSSHLKSRQSAQD